MNSRNGSHHNNSDRDFNQSFRLPKVAFYDYEPFKFMSSIPVSTEKKSMQEQNISGIYSKNESLTQFHIKKLSLDLKAKKEASSQFDRSTRDSHQKPRQRSKRDRSQDDYYQKSGNRVMNKSQQSTTIKHSHHQSSYIQPNAYDTNSEMQLTYQQMTSNKISADGATKSQFNLTFKNLNKSQEFEGIAYLQASQTRHIKKNSSIQANSKRKGYDVFKNCTNSKRDSDNKLLIDHLCSLSINGVDKDIRTKLENTKDKYPKAILKESDVKFNKDNLKKNMVIQSNNNGTLNSQQIQKIISSQVKADNQIVDHSGTRGHGHTHSNPKTFHRFNNSLYEEVIREGDEEEESELKKPDSSIHNTPKKPQKNSDSSIHNTPKNPQKNSDSSIQKTPKKPQKNSDKSKDPTKSIKISDNLETNLSPTKSNKNISHSRGSSQFLQRIDTNMKAVSRSNHKQNQVNSNVSGLQNLLNQKKSSSGRMIVSPNYENSVTSISEDNNQKLSVKEKEIRNKLEPVNSETATNSLSKSRKRFSRFDRKITDDSISRDFKSITAHTFMTKRNKKPNDSMLKKINIKINEIEKEPISRKLARALEKNKNESKWNQSNYFFILKKAFDEQKHTLRIFISQRKHHYVAEIYDDFCQAVANNPCCVWLKTYFIHPEQLDKQNYNLFANNPENLNGSFLFIIKIGLTNLVDDLSMYLCEKTYDKYCISKNELEQRDIRLQYLKSRFKNKFLKRNVDLLKNTDQLERSPIYQVTFFLYKKKAATIDGHKMGNFNRNFKISESIEKIEDKNVGYRMPFVSSHSRIKNSKANLMLDHINYINRIQTDRFVVIDKDPYGDVREANKLKQNSYFFNSEDQN